MASEEPAEPPETTLQIDEHLPERLWAELTAI
jgi:hypothetical protein